MLDLYTGSGWFNRGAPPRTFSNLFSAEKTMCVVVFHLSSGWYDETEPPTHKGRKVCTVHLHLFRVVQPRRTSSHLLEPLQCRENNVRSGLSPEFRGGATRQNHLRTRGGRCVWYIYTCSGWFNCGEPPRTFSNHFSAEKARCVEVSYLSSGWFDYTEPHNHKGVKVCTLPRHMFREVQPR